MPHFSCFTPHFLTSHGHFLRWGASFLTSLWSFFWCWHTLFWTRLTRFHSFISSFLHSSAAHFIPSFFHFFISAQRNFSHRKYENSRKERLARRERMRETNVNNYHNSVHKLLFLYTDGTDFGDIQFKLLFQKRIRIVWRINKKVFTLQMSTGKSSFVTPASSRVELQRRCWYGHNSL